MANSYIYIPGLARADAGGGDMLTILRNLFWVMDRDGDVGRDRYMLDVVRHLTGKGCTPLLCRARLRWMQVPRASKAMHILGTVGQNVLRKEDATKTVPVKMSLGFDMTPCSLPEFLAQPRPSAAVAAAAGDPPLNVLADGDTLYLVGHSNANGGSMSYKCLSPVAHHHRIGEGGCKGWQHMERWHVDPVVTAALLIDDGLPRARLDIAVLACFSGGVAEEERQTVQSFAQRLAGALAGHGYEQITVSGALGLTSGSEQSLNVKGGYTVGEDGKTLTVDPNQRGSSAPDPASFTSRFFRFFRPRP